jgi:hypothetical protein
MTDSTESAWQKIRECKRFDPDARTLCVKMLGDVYMPADGGSDAMFVTSHTMCAAGWRHDNLLRPIRRYVDQHPGDAGVHLFKAGSQVRSAIFWLPTLQRFIVWLLNSLKGHEADQQRRCTGFMETFSYLSGLRKLRVIEFHFVQCRNAWPEEMRDDKITWEYKPSTQLLLDFYQKDLTAQQRIDITRLATRCGYSEKHVRRKLKAAQVEFGVDSDPNFLTVAADNTVSRKTAMFLLLSLPKLLRSRLLVFNDLYHRLTPTPVPTPVGIPEYLEQTDFNNPTQAAQACLTLVERNRRQQQFHTRQLAASLQRVTDAQGEVGVLRAELAGKNEELARLKTSMAQVVAAGSFLRSEETDNMVYHASQLRQDHGWCTIQDLERKLMEKYGPDELLAALHSVLPNGPRGLGAAVRHVIRFEIGQKNLRADGQPVLRPEIVSFGDACVRRTYVSNASRAGHQAKYGVDRTWRWSVFFTPQGVRRIVSSFMQLIEAWLAARCPRHMLEQEPSGDMT